MNTIKDLAVQWWESLPIKRNKELLFKYHPDESLDYKKIENIFYNEVIVKWFYNDYYNTLVTPEAGYRANLMTADDIISLYLKGHSKPKKVLREINIDVSFELSKEREEEIDNLMKEHSKEETTLVTSAEQLDEIMDEIFEQPLSVNKDIEVGEEKTYPCIKCNKLRTKAEGGTTFSVCDDCWNKPKVEVDSWDEANIRYEEYIKNCKIKKDPFFTDDYIGWLRINYTLTKKQQLFQK